ncbi:MAG: hypothetical protein L0H12_02885, partial [Nitrosospira sp.]|nr:hypothetical protein [Nitrosospira sp.]
MNTGPLDDPCESCRLFVVPLLAAEAFVLVAETFVAAEALVSSGGCGVVLAEVLVSGVFVSAEGLV